MPPRKARNGTPQSSPVTRKSNRNKPQPVPVRSDEALDDEVVLSINDLEAVTESSPGDDDTSFMDEIGQDAVTIGAESEFDDADSPRASSESESKGFQCQVCEKVFTRKYHLDRHLHLTRCSGKAPPGLILIRDWTRMVFIRFIEQLIRVRFVAKCTPESTIYENICVYML
jgi:glycerol-3-phosphate cytidylyltransferase-like family protein